MKNFVLSVALLLFGASAMASAERVRSVTLPNGLPLHQFRFANGLTLFLVENHSAPVFTFQTWFKVGSKDEKLDPKLNATGLAHLFEHMMFRGTERFPDGEFDDLLTRAGVNDENATTWFDRTNYYQSLPSNQLDLVLKLESDRMVNLVVDQELLDTERGAVLGEYRMGLDDPDSLAFDTLFSNAFTVHPYRFTTIGTEEEIKHFSPADAVYFYKKYYAPNNATIVIVGDVTSEQALPLIDQYYGAFAAQMIDRPAAPVEPVQALERTVEFKHAQLSAPKLLIGYHVPEAVHADVPALNLLVSLLSEGEASVLTQIWVNSGLAAKAGGSMTLLKDPGLLVLSADVQAGKEPRELLAALDAKLAAIAMASRESLAKDLERARNQYLLGVYTQWEDSSSLASFFGEYIQMADDPLVAFEQVSALDRVTVAELQQAIRKYLIPSNRTVVIGRPADDERAAR